MVKRDEHPAATAAEVVKQLMGKYEIGRLLGRGAFAKVYRGRHLQTGQSVAIKAVSKKRLAKEAGGHEDVIKREIGIMRRMRHPHIIRLQEVLATKTKIFFIMELANRGELFSKVAKGGRFSEDLSRHYFHQLLSAVSHCHSHGIFHRDLKLENLLLDDNWNLKVTDFGLSAVRDDQIHSNDDGMLHTICGTPAYVAPEILAKKGYDGSKVDIWSCGVILFVLNAGYLPFNHHNLMVMYRKIYKGQFRCPNWTSPELKRFLRRLLDTNPNTRITVDEIIKDPWFQRPNDKAAPVKLLINVDHHHDLYDFFDDAKESNDGGGGNCLNAFDIISFSSGFDLSGLVSKEEEEAGCEVERFVSVETAEVIMERVEEAAATAGLRMVNKMGWGGRLEGQTGGHFRAVIRISRLTKELLVVEVKTREVRNKSEYSGGDSDTDGGGIWKNILWPNLSGLIYRPDPLIPMH